MEGEIINNKLKSNKKSGYIIKSVINSFKTLEIMGDMGNVGVTELSSKLNVSKTTAFNILCTLEKIDYVKQNNESGKYTLSAKILELSSELEFKLREIAKPHLRNLRRQFDETINLVIRSGHKVLYIEKVESSQPIQINTKIGKKEDIYCTAVGKAILAYLDRDIRDNVLNKINFYPHTENTITSLEELKKDLLNIKQKGYAVDNEEFSEGVRCLAAPIFGHKEAVRGAISITGPVDRMIEKNEKKMAYQVINTSKKITKDLGGRLK